MIYPQSFPNLFSSFAEEQLYDVLSNYTHLYDSFYKTAFFIEREQLLLDYIIIDKNQGVLIFQIIEDDPLKIWAQHFHKVRQAVRQALESLNLSSAIIVEHAVWEGTEAVENFKAWFDNYFVTEKNSIPDNDLKIITQYFKKSNLFYTPPGKLSGIDISGYKGIKTISLKKLPTDASWIFVTGENGFGKTCLLQAIALGLYSSEKLNADTGLFSKLKDFFSKSEPKHYNDENYNHAVHIQVLTDNLLEGKHIYEFPKNEKAKVFRNVCAYGAARLDTYDENNSKKNDTPILSLFSTKSLLRNIELSLKSWVLSDLEVNKQKFEHTKKLLEKLLDGMEIIVSKTSQRVWYKEKKDDQYYEPITLDNLAAGYRSLLAMVGDIIIRLFDAQPDIVNPAELEGIVIIDELDLHWHPKWQKKIPGLLTELFPLVQFVASTHSPVPLLGAPEGSVFLKVNRTIEEGITVARLKKLESEIKTLTPNAILTSDIFDFDFFKNYSEEEFDKLHVEDNYNDIKKNKELDERLKNLDPKLFPDDLFLKEK